MAKQFAQNGFDLLIASGSDDIQKAAADTSIQCRSSAASSQFGRARRHSPVDIGDPSYAGADDTKLGASGKDDPAEVAKDGYEELMVGKDRVIAGSLKNKFQAAAGYAFPDPQVAKPHAAMAGPGSASKK